MRIDQKEEQLCQSTTSGVEPEISRELNIGEPKSSALAIRPRGPIKLFDGSASPSQYHVGYDPGRSRHPTSSPEDNRKIARAETSAMSKSLFWTSFWSNSTIECLW